MHTLSLHDALPISQSIGHLDDRLTRQEQGSEQGEEKADAEDPAPANGPAQEEGLKVVVSNGGSEESEVVQLQAEEKAKFGEDGKANPVEARVLVRREAAKAAHAFQREKHTQGDWDERAGPASRQVGFSWLMDNYPKSTVVVTTTLVAGLIAATIFWMEDLIAGRQSGKELNIVAPEGTSLSRLMADDPEAAMAETVARGYLNATSAKAALPFVWGSEAIRDKFERYFKPLSQPDSYELKLQDRGAGKDGKETFLYRVNLPGEKARRLLVLPEGAMPKVFWEFFEEVGDVSWADFLKRKPQNPAEMRVWLYPVEKYIEGYEADKWRSYMLHDYAEKHRILAYAPRDKGDDWQISDALRNEPVSFNRHEAVMALLKLTYKSEFKIEDSTGAVAEIEDVMATSWLPEGFRGKRQD